MKLLFSVKVQPISGNKLMLRFPSSYRKVENHFQVGE